MQLHERRTSIEKNETCVEGQGREAINNVQKAKGHVEQSEEDDEKNYPCNVLHRIHQENFCLPNLLDREASGSPE